MSTVLLTYKGTAPVIASDANLVAQPGETYAIPEDIAASLLERPEWAKAKAAKESDS